MTVRNAAVQHDDGTPCQGDTCAWAGDGGHVSVPVVHRHATHEPRIGTVGFPNACPTVCGLPCDTVPEERLAFSGEGGKHGLTDADVTCKACLKGKGGPTWRKS